MKHLYVKIICLSILIALLLSACNFAQQEERSVQWSLTRQLYINALTNRVQITPGDEVVLCVAQQNAQILSTRFADPKVDQDLLKSKGFTLTGNIQATRIDGENTEPITSFGIKSVTLFHNGDKIIYNENSQFSFESRFKIVVETDKEQILDESDGMMSIRQIIFPVELEPNVCFKFTGK